MTRPTVDALILSSPERRDRRVGDKLAGQLNTYRTPRRLVYGLAALRRQVSVRHVTATTADGEEQTPYLIVLCSRAARTDPGIGQTIARFLEREPADRVLLVLLERDLDSCVPEILRSHITLPLPDEGRREALLDSLAVDLSAVDLKSEERLLRRERLRLLAPLLGTTFAVLDERERLRARQRLRAMLTAIGLAVVIPLLLVAISTFQRTWHREVGDFWREVGMPENNQRYVQLAALANGHVMGVNSDAGMVIWDAHGTVAFHDGSRQAKKNPIGDRLLVADNRRAEEDILDLATKTKVPSGIMRGDPERALTGYFVGSRGTILVSMTAGEASPLLRLFDTEAGQEIARLPTDLSRDRYTSVGDHFEFGPALDMSTITNTVLDADSQRLVTYLPAGGRRLIPTLWDVSSSRRLGSLECAPDGSNPLFAIDPAAHQILTVEANQKGLSFCRWASETGMLVERRETDLPSWPGATVSDDASTIFVPTATGHVVIVDGRKLVVTPPDGDPWRIIGGFVPDAPSDWKTMYWLSRTTRSRTGSEIWHQPSGERLEIAQLTSDRLRTLAVSSKRSRFIAQQGDSIEWGNLSDPSTRRPLGTLQPTERVGVSLDGNGIVIQQHGGVTVFDAGTGEALGTFDVPGSWPLAAVDPARQRIVFWTDTGLVLRYIRRREVLGLALP